jgi:hypothetical protein
MVSTPVDVYVNPTKRKIGFLEKRLEKAIENENYELAFQAAVHSLESGAANNCLKKLISLQ